MFRLLINWLMLATITVVGGLVLVEVMLRLIYPQPHMFPRYTFSERYGHALPPSTKIVEELGGEWRFEYTTDAEGHRAVKASLSNNKDLPNIVLLGDSFTFGEGVNDGEEYASILGRKLDGKAGVINLGVPGYGLTQEIRTYYEYGKRFKPEIVMINFAFNDPDDGLMDPVTVVKNGRFSFRPARPLGRLSGWLKSYLRDSVIQYSHTYNFLRTFAYKAFRSGRVDSGRMEKKSAAYNRLLEAFARNLSAEGIDLIVFGVNGHFQRFPAILDKVRELEKLKLLTYIETIPWFEHETDFASPEGHSWGAKAQRIVADRLYQALLPHLK